MLSLSEAESLKDKANHAYRNGEKDMAFRLYKQVLEAQPDPEVGQELLRTCKCNAAAAAFDLTLIDESIEYARQVIDSAPSPPTSTSNKITMKGYLRLATALKSLAEYDQALKALDDMSRSGMDSTEHSELRKEIKYWKKNHPKPKPGPGKVVVQLRLDCDGRKHDFLLSAPSFAVTNASLQSRQTQAYVQGLVLFGDQHLSRYPLPLCAECGQQLRVPKFRHSPMFFLNRSPPLINDPVMPTCSAACDDAAKRFMMEMGATSAPF